jgi:hypothetical protein
MRWLFGLVVLVFRGDRAKDAELLVLRHENAALRRQASRVRYEPADRAWFAALGPVHPAAAAGKDLPGDTRDAAGLAAQTGCAEIRHEHAPTGRPPARGPEYRPDRRPPGERESAEGLPADPRRANQARSEPGAVNRL